MGRERDPTVALGQPGLESFNRRGVATTVNAQRPAIPYDSAESVAAIAGRAVSRCALGVFKFMESGDDLAPQAARLAPKLRALAEQQIYFGTSSWKYEGWLGTVYNRSRYESRGRFSQRKFETECLAEYAATFPVVCGDFAFYQFPSPEYWERLFDQTPPPFLFGFKVPEEITVARWPGHARYGARAGTENLSFLDARLFRSLFAQRLEPYAERVATLIFEFGTFPRAMFPSVDHFLARLDPFLGDLPQGFRYAIEIRNAEYLGTDYFDVLASRGVAHVFNAWTRMPQLDAQAALPGAFTAGFSVVRALLAKGRSYEQAVQAFSPYDRTVAPNTAARDGLRHVAEHSRRTREPAFLFVNNRVEGHAPTTIEAVVEQLGV